MNEQFRVKYSFYVHVWLTLNTDHTLSESISTCDDVLFAGKAVGFNFLVCS